MAQRRYEPLSVTDWFLFLLLALGMLLIFFVIVGTFTGVISEPSWITQRWPYPGTGRPIQ